MNLKYLTSFETRQEMARNDFEIFFHNDADSMGLALHSHRFYELYCLLSGNVGYMIDGKHYPLQPGSMQLIAPGELHRPEYPTPAGDVERIVMWLSTDFIRSLTGFLPRVQSTLMGGMKGRNLIMPDEETRQLMIGLLGSLLHEKELADPDSEYLSRLAVTQLLIHLCRCLSRSPEQSSAREEQRYGEVMRVYEYIGEHLQDSSLSVSRLAERFCMDKNTLTRQFKRFVGLTPGECIRRGRLEAAHLMIRHGASMQEACAECGFSDYSAFYRAFHRAYGTSPSACAAQSRRTKDRDKRQEATT